jgi:hypothetical protein
MNKNFLSKFAVLTLAAGIFGYVVPTVFAAAPAGSMTGTALTIKCEQTTTAVSTLTVTSSGAEITDANDLRIRIQSTTNAIFDTAETTLTLGGTASAKASGTVTYPNTKTVLIPISDDFTDGQTLTVSGLKVIGGTCAGIGSTSAKPLQWSVDGSIYGNGNANTSITVTKELTTTTEIGNEPPIFTVNATDASNGTTPTNVGATTTWTATATDPNSDSYWLAICKTAAVTPGAAGIAPTCTGGEWAISAGKVLSTTASPASNTATRTALIGDAQSNEWYAYACDDNVSNPLCSLISGAGVDPTPFKVNHAPIINSVTSGNAFATPSTVTPGNGTGGQVFFRLVVTDTDNDTAQDSITYYICSSSAWTVAGCGATTFGTGTVANPFAGPNADNNSNTLIPIPTAHETNIPYYIFVKDSHELRDDAIFANSQSVTVTDVAPTVGTYTVNDISPTAGGSVTTAFSVLVSDNNGDNDIVTVNGFIYDDNAIDLTAGECTSAEKNCYSRPACTFSNVSTPATLGGSLWNTTPQSGDVQLTATCDAITTWYNINPTSLGADWRAHVNAIDSAPNTTIGADSGTQISVASLSAVAVAETSIAYNATTAGGDSTVRAESNTTLANAGNIEIDVGIRGTSMARSGGGFADIPVGAQKWSANAGYSSYETGGQALLALESVPGVAAQGCSNRDMAVRSDRTIGSSDYVLRWMIRIPPTQASGVYTGTNTFTSVVSDQCTGSDA